MHNTAAKPPAEVIADLHIHSHYSRATSPQCTLVGLQHWAQLKGVTLIGTGDCTHPEWFREISRDLTPAEPGLYKLKPEPARAADAEVFESCRQQVRFLITGEISHIYKRGGRVRKVHSVIAFPDLETAAAVNRKLDKIGNIRSDGRPILGLDPRNLLEIMLETSPDSMLIPAHIWTPWFSMLGSKSGFDSITECFGDLAEHIFAVETGLSSDPPMNWRISSLDRVSLVSNSDLHSPANLGRNANIFRVPLAYHALRDALREKDPDRFGGTIDMFPEEGKYHCDGHRKCKVQMEPENSLAHDNLCPKCGKPLTLGVLHRVVELADRPQGCRPANALPHEYIIPLPEILGELLNCGTNTKAVQAAYHKLLKARGPELDILRNLDPDALADCGVDLLPEALRRLRRGQVTREPGYDGEYGRIRLFGDDDKAQVQERELIARSNALRARLSTPAADEAKDSAAAGDGFCLQ
jgi:DNA helicase-2/ATP-dependent DNA helicase PcrA